MTFYSGVVIKTNVKAGKHKFYSDFKINSFGGFLKVPMGPSLISLMIPWLLPQIARVQAPLLRAAGQNLRASSHWPAWVVPSSEPVAIARSGLSAWAWPQAEAELGWFAETAVNIGYACQLLSEDMHILEEEQIM